MKKYIPIFAILSLSTPLVRVPVFAQAVPATPEFDNLLSDPSTAVSDIQVSDLQSQIKSLSHEIASLKGEIASLKVQLLFNRTLQKKSAGTDVKQIQDFFSTFPDIYPEGQVTGYFGELTENAVKRFQKVHGIPETGIVGPLTRNELTREMSEEINHREEESGNNPSLVAATTSIASSLPTSTPNIASSSPDLSSPSDASQTDLLDNAPPPEADFYIFSSPTESTTTTTTTTSNVSQTITSAPAPISSSTSAVTLTLTISNIYATTTKNSATITWSTNVSSTGEVDYSMKIDLSSAKKVQNSMLTTAHSIILSGLENKQTYYFIVISADSTSKTATSSELSFTTNSD